MSIFKQKRKTTRKALIYYLEVFDGDLKQTVGRTIDLTTDGIQLVSEKPMEAGKMYQLNMRMPEKILEISEMHFNCRCVRSEKDRHSEYFYSGLQFKDKDPAYEEVIELLISDYGF